MKKNYTNWDWRRYFFEPRLISKIVIFFTCIVLLILTIGSTPLSAKDLPVKIPHLTAVMPICDGNADGVGTGTMVEYSNCLLYTSPSPRDKRQSRMPSSA